jgi:DNA gyrase subunit A
MGSYHPHGDSSIYEALARMVQEFSMRHPLVDGHGNFGGTGPDEGPAAMRYTECRLGSLALELMSGIDQETVDFVPNYDATSEEPTVLPARFPNMLVNGSQGIAVGMATNIASPQPGRGHRRHHPPARAPCDATPDDLMEFVKGPDFPTGRSSSAARGSSTPCAPGGAPSRCGPWPRSKRVGPARPASWSEMPYQASIASVAKKIEDLVRAGDLDGIAEAQDDSSGGKTRLVIRLKRDANANVVLNNLFKQTPMQTTFSVNAVALVDGVPRTLNLAQMLTHYVAHQVEVVTRRSSSCSTRPGPGPMWSKGCSRPSTCWTRSSPPSGRLTTARPPSRRCRPTRSSSPRSRPTTSWT